MGKEQSGMGAERPFQKRNRFISVVEQIAGVNSYGEVDFPFVSSERNIQTPTGKILKGARIVRARDLYHHIYDETSEYPGSHLVKIVETKITYKDEDGNVQSYFSEYRRIDRHLETGIIKRNSTTGKGVNIAEPEDIDEATEITKMFLDTEE